MRALITGINGQDGSYLTELLLKKGYKVFGLARNTETSFPRGFTVDPGAELTILPGDMRNQDSLERALRIANPDELYNLAAQSHVGTSFAEPEMTMEINYAAVSKLFEAARDINPSIRIYQASSSEMFGATPAPQNEQSPFAPISPYAISKYKAYEEFVVGARDAGKGYICSGILYNHESPRRRPIYVTRKITQSMAQIARGERDSFELGNLDSARDWGYAKDYVEMMWRMLQQEVPEDFVISTGVTHTVRDFVNAAAAALEMPLSWKGEGLNEAAQDANGKTILQINPDFYRPQDVQDLRGNSAKARSMLGFEPSVTFEELVALMAIADYNESHEPAARLDHHSLL